MLKVKYRVTGSFGQIPEGTVIDCYVLNRDGVKALIYHPPTAKYYNGEKIVVDKGCGSFEFCEENSQGEYVSIDDESYVNFGEMDVEFKKFLKDSEKKKMRSK